MSDQNFIVTGGAGFVGSNLVAELLRRFPGCHVVVLDDLRSGSFANIVEACQRTGVGTFPGRIIPVSISDFDLEWLVESYAPRAVFHLAAITDTTVMSEPEMIRVNAESFPPLLDACREHKAPLVYASSAATYGTPPQTAQRKAFPPSAAGHPNNVYGFSKWLLESHHRVLGARIAKETGKVPHVVGLRYFNVFGPGESRKGKMASMVFQLGTQMLAGQRPRIFADGTQSRDQVYVDDVVDCTIHAAALTGAKVTPGIYNLGSGTPTSFLDIVTSLRAALSIPESRLPTDLFEMPASVRAFYQDFTLADMSDTKKGLGWEPKWTPRDAIAAYAKELLRSRGASR